MFAFAQKVHVILTATEGRIALFTSELVESDLIMLQKNRAGHGQGQGYKF